MKTVTEVIGVSRSNLIERMRERAKKRIGRPPLPDDNLVAEIKAVIAELPTYGYRRVHAILKRQALAAGLKPPNHKRVYRVMKVHDLLLDRHAGGGERPHDGRIAVDERNRRWCSDGFEIGCDNGERVRVAFALDCCDREAMSFLATTSGVSGEDVRDLMLAAVEHRFGPVNRLPVTIEWLSDNGSCYLAGETRSFARNIGLDPRTTPIESPQSNGMAEAFVRTIKRDYVRVSPRPDAETVMRQLPPSPSRPARSRRTAPRKRTAVSASCSRQRPSASFTAWRRRVWRLGSISLRSSRAISCELTTRRTADFGAGLTLSSTMPS